MQDNTGRCSKVLIVRLSSIGDVIHGLPVVRAITDAMPGIRIDWMVEESAAQLLSGDEEIDTVWVFRRRSKGWRSLGGILAGIRRQRYDVVIDLQGLLKSAVIARLAGAPRVIGFNRPTAREGSFLFYSQPVDASKPVHVVDKNLCLVRDGLGIALPPQRWGICCGAAAHRAVEAWLDGRGAGRRVVVLNPGGTRSNKMWSGGRWARLASLLARDGVLVVVAWGPGEQTLADSIVALSGHPGVAAAPPTDLLELAALIARSDCLVSGDSAPLHMASAQKIPVVGLFGSTDASRNGPHRVSSRVIRGECSRGPCWKKRCADRVCMRRISTEGVYHHVKTLLGEAEL